MIRAVALVLIAAAAVNWSAVEAHSHKKKNMEIVHPWTAENLNPKIENISVYMTIKNRGPSADRLVRVEAPLAQKAELVDIQNQAGMKLPSPVSSLAIPARGELEMNSDGPRLVLMGFFKRFSAYDSFKLILVFEKAGSIPIDVMVEEAEASHQNHKH